MQSVEITHFHLFCGLGGGARGFNRGEARVGKCQAKFRCLGGIDVDPAAIRDFGRLAGVPGTVLDLFDREQYVAFHGREPPDGWKEATPADLRRAAGNERPNIVFASSPCKGFSNLLSESRSKMEKYQALNRLTVRGVWLALEAWADDPPEFILFENVPRIANRGRPLLDRIVQMLGRYGYAVAETTHDCGALGGLGQSRKRFLLVARHMEKVPPFLYEPEKRPLRGVSDIIGRLPLPGDPAAGPMHRIPHLQWKTWVRLAFVEAGSDWRSLDRLAVRDGTLRDYLILPERRRHYLGVTLWTDPSGAISGRSTPTNGRYAVADPRFTGQAFGQYGIIPWNEAANTVTTQRSPGQGPFSVADPRPGPIVADTYVIAHRAAAVEDRGPSVGCLTGGDYSVMPGPASDDAGIAVDRPADRLPGSDDNVVAVIRALDNTWHRPFTTLDLAALQGLVDPDEHLELTGLSDSAYRERIGNAVPSPAAQAIANVMGTTLLLALNGESFTLSALPIWVRPVAVALAVDQPPPRA